MISNRLQIISWEWHNREIHTYSIIDEYVSISLLCHSQLMIRRQGYVHIFLSLSIWDLGISFFVKSNILSQWLCCWAPESRLQPLDPDSFLWHCDFVCIMFTVYTCAIFTCIELLLTYLDIRTAYLEKQRADDVAGQNARTRFTGWHLALLNTIAAVCIIYIIIIIIIIIRATSFIRYNTSTYSLH